MFPPSLCLWSRYVPDKTLLGYLLSHIHDRLPLADADTLCQCLAGFAALTVTRPTIAVPVTSDTSDAGDISDTPGSSKGGNAATSSERKPGGAAAVAIPEDMTNSSSSSSSSGSSSGGSNSSVAQLSASWLSSWYSAASRQLLKASPPALAAAAVALGNLQLQPPGDILGLVTLRASEVMEEFTPAELSGLISALADMKWRPSDTWLQVGGGMGGIRGGRFVPSMCCSTPLFFVTA